MSLDNPSPREFQNPGLLEEYTGLLTDLSMLIGELDAYEISDEATYDFTFSVNEDTFIPAEVLALDENIRELKITGRYETEGDASFISIDFVGKNSTLTVSAADDTSSSRRLPITRLGIGSMKSQESEEVGSMSTASLNQLVTGLISPDLHKPSELANLLSEEAFYALRNSLDLSAVDDTTWRSHALGNTGVTLAYQSNLKDKTSFRISYPDKVTGQLLHLTGNLESGFNMEFRADDITTEPILALGRTGLVDLGTVSFENKTPLSPAKEDVVYLRSLITTELVSINPVQATVAEDEFVNFATAEEEFMKTGRITYGRGNVREALDQLGLDPSDPGA